jgi:DNA-binding response OmpR family regulator
MNARTRLLVVDDDPSVRSLLREYLDGHGFAVAEAANGAQMRAEIERELADAVLLDIRLPGEDGLVLARYLRERYDLGILMVTASGDVVDRVVGLELGADDYIAKPFSPRELVARVKAVLRRFERPLAPSPLKVGEIEIDPSAMTLTVRGQTVATTATEFRLLDYFARHVGRVFTRDNLLDSVWRDTSYVTPRSVDVYVRRIREKIEPDPENPRYLKTVRGAGYRFESPK